MRTIKFRAWDKKENKLYYLGDKVYLGDLNSKKLNIMQYTGLKDKHGTEIYEGDIVQFDMPLSPKPQIRQIVYKERYAAFTVKNGDYFPIEDWNVEVIGNIYENPELLRQL